MGEAKQRGTLEERVKSACERKKQPKFYQDYGEECFNENNVSILENSEFLIDSQNIIIGDYEYFFEMTVFFNCPLHSNKKFSTTIRFDSAYREIILKQIKHGFLCFRMIGITNDRFQEKSSLLFYRPINAIPANPLFHRPVK